MNNNSTIAGRTAGFADPAGPLHVDRRFRPLPFGRAGCCKARFPNRPVDVLTTTLCAPLLDYMPGVRKGIVCDLPRKRLAFGAAPRAGARLASRALRHALVMPRTWKSALAPFLAGIPERTGFAGEAAFWPAQRHPLRRKEAAPHDRPLRRAGPAEGRGSARRNGRSPQLEVPATAGRRVARRARPARRRPAGGGVCARRGRAEQALAAISPNWPASSPPKGSAVWVLGSPAEAPLAAEIVAAAGPTARDLTSTDLRNAILALKLRRRLRVERLRPRACRRRHRHADRRHLRPDQPLALGAAQSARRRHRDQDRRALPALPQADLPARPSPLHASTSPRPGAAGRPSRIAAHAGAGLNLRGTAAPATRPAMADPRQETVIAYLRRSQQAVERVIADGKFVAATVAVAERIAASLKSGGKLLLAGNGGSAADAQHIAAEFVGRFIKDRAPLAAIALTTDTSALTAIGNDYGFEQVFERQLRALGRKGDVFDRHLDVRPFAQRRRGAQGGARTRPCQGRFHQRMGQPRCTRCAISCWRCRPRRPR